MSSDDRALVSAFLVSRSESAFRALYRAHARSLFALALRLTGGRREDAEEALQEAWLRAIERLDSFRFESALRTWLSGIVIRSAHELRRRRHPEREEPKGGWEIEELAPPTAPVASAIDLERALAELPATLRDVVVLHELEGMGHEEIGALLAIPAGTSKSRLHFAKRALRTRLGAAARVAESSDQSSGEPR